MINSFPLYLHPLRANNCKWQRQRWIWRQTLHICVCIYLLQWLQWHYDCYMPWPDHTCVTLAAHFPSLRVFMRFSTLFRSFYFLHIFRGISIRMKYATDGFFLCFMSDSTGTAVHSLDTFLFFSLYRRSSLVAFGFGIAFVSWWYS